jgi:hypothetical protein
MLAKKPWTCTHAHALLRDTLDVQASLRPRQVQRGMLTLPLRALSYDEKMDLNLILVSQCHVDLMTPAGGRAVTSHMAQSVKPGACLQHEWCLKSVKCTTSAVKLISMRAKVSHLHWQGHNTLQPCMKDRRGGRTSGRPSAPGMWHEPAAWMPCIAQSRV